MKLGTEVGLDPGHIVLDGNLAPLTLHPPQKGGTVANFRLMSVVAKWMDGLRCHLVRRQVSAQATLCYMGTQLPPREAQPPIFGPCLLWPRSLIYAAAELLLNSRKSMCMCVCVCEDGTDGGSGVYVAWTWIAE